MQKYIQTMPSFEWSNVLKTPHKSCIGIGIGIGIGIQPSKLYET